MYSAALDFIGHINDIAGRDPLESSLGDDKLLPKFVVSLHVVVFIIDYMYNVRLTHITVHGYRLCVHAWV